MNRPATKSDASSPRSGTVVDPRMSLALWLKAGRNERGMSLDDVARVTKIQARILERLEGGKLDNLPAEVFVRGFIRSFAKCCGLDEAEALSRYSAASQAQLAAPPVAPSPQARAMVEVMMGEPVGTIAATATAVEAKPDVVSIAPPMSDMAQGSIVQEIPEQQAKSANKKKRRGAKRARRNSGRSAMATGTPSDPTPIVEAVETVEPEPVVEAAPAPAIIVEEAPFDTLDPLVAPPADDDNQDIVATETWQPKMPLATPAPTVPWRRPSLAAPTRTGASVPSLVIDDSDPESAAQVLEDREEARSVLTIAQRRSFLPPALLDREDRSARQGGLTLAVIILLIAATLTLSYLMRRPSSSGDGVTTVETAETMTIG